MAPSSNVTPLRPLGDDELELILADLARTGSSSTRLQAVRMLMELRRARPPEPGAGDPFAEFSLAALDPPPRRKKKPPA